MKNLFLNQFIFHMYLIFQHWKKRMLEEASHNKIQVGFWVSQLPLGSGSHNLPSCFFSFLSSLSFTNITFLPLYIYFTLSFFWSVFSCIWTDYGDLRSIQENTDQKKLHIWTLFTQCLWRGRENKKMLGDYSRTIFCFFCQQA